MVTRWKGLCLLVLGLASGLNVALAQQGDDPLNGYWKQVGESVYIVITLSEGGYEAEVMRNDWAPGLVGTKIFENVLSVSNKKPRWAGDTFTVGSNESGKATLSLDRSGELRTRLKPGGRAKWKRTDPIEKRY
ncbi:MAG: hypothetical protein JKX81_11375 [Arenicella sp.]|nr:hypothetical protein [Arenicella sp.]